MPKEGTKKKSKMKKYYFPKIKKFLFLLFLGIISTSVDAQTPPTGPDSLVYFNLRNVINRSGLDMEGLRNNEKVIEFHTKNNLDINRTFAEAESNISKDTIGDPTIFPPLEKIEGVAMIGKSYGDSIVLRWSPTTPLLWAKTNAEGFSLKRYTLDDSLEVIENSMVELAGNSKPLIKPWTLEKVQTTLTRKDSFALIAAQLLHRSSYESSGEDRDIILKKREFDNRFGFSLLAADNSPLAAELLGLRYTDKAVEQDKYYLYWLSTTADTSQYATPVYAMQNRPSQEPIPNGFIIQPEDHLLSIYWPKSTNKYFSSFNIQRSDDGGNTFKNLNDKPFIFPTRNYEGNTEKGIGNPDSDNYQVIDLNNYYEFHDSVSENYKTYIYRFQGLNPFGEWTQYTEIKEQARDLTPPPAPSIIATEILDDGRGKIAWMGEKTSDMAGFKVLEANSVTQLFEPIHDGLLSPNITEFITPEPLDETESHYYKVQVFDDKDNFNESFPQYLHLVDSIAPAAPQNIQFHIDTLGIVTLVWDAGEEKDVAGYRVYFSNHKDYEFTQLTRDPIEYNFFRDTIEILTLTENIYYQIQTVDNSHNRSDFSEIIEVQKPDILPPVVPILHQPIMNDSIIILLWTPSSSEDVEAHLVYRRKYKSTDDWEILATLTATDTSFTDLTAETEQLYEYTLRAQDDAGLFSDYSFIHKARKWFDGKIISIQNLALTQDTTSRKHIKIIWEFEPPTEGFLKDVEHRFYLYKSKGDAPLERYKQLKDPARAFIDVNVSQKTQYNYAMKVVFVNGKTSPLSDMVSMEK